MPISLTRWLQLASPEQARKLAKLARTSVKSLRHIAAGRRNGSAEAAIRIVAAAAQIETNDRGSNRPIDQASVCPACRKCPHYPKATR